MTLSSQEGATRFRQTIAEAAYKINPEKYAPSLASQKNLSRREFLKVIPIGTAAAAILPGNLAQGAVKINFPQALMKLGRGEEISKTEENAVREQIAENIHQAKAGDAKRFKKMISMMMNMSNQNDRETYSRGFVTIAAKVAKGEIIHLLNQIILPQTDQSKREEPVVYAGAAHIIKAIALDRKKLITREIVDTLVTLLSQEWLDFDPGTIVDFTRTVTANGSTKQTIFQAPQTVGKRRKKIGNSMFDCIYVYTKIADALSTIAYERHDLINDAMVTDLKKIISSADSDFYAYGGAAQTLIAIGESKGGAKRISQNRLNEIKSFMGLWSEIQKKFRWQFDHSSAPIFDLVGIGQVWSNTSFTAVLNNEFQGRFNGQSWSLARGVRNLLRDTGFKVNTISVKNAIALIKEEQAVHARTMGIDGNTSKIMVVSGNDRIMYPAHQQCLDLAKGLNVPYQGFVGDASNKNEILSAITQIAQQSADLLSNQNGPVIMFNAHGRLLNYQDRTFDPRISLKITDDREGYHEVAIHAMELAQALKKSGVKNLSNLKIILISCNAKSISDFDLDTFANLLTSSLSDQGYVAPFIMGEANTGESGSTQTDRFMNYRDPYLDAIIDIVKTHKQITIGDFCTILEEHIWKTKNQDPFVTAPIAPERLAQFIQKTARELGKDPAQFNHPLVPTIDISENDTDMPDLIKTTLSSQQNLSVIKKLIQLKTHASNVVKQSLSPDLVGVCGLVKSGMSLAEDWKKIRRLAKPSDWVHVHEAILWARDNHMTLDENEVLHTVSMGVAATDPARARTIAECVQTKTDWGKIAEAVARYGDMSANEGFFTTMKQDEVTVITFSGQDVLDSPEAFQAAMDKVPDEKVQVLVVAKNNEDKAKIKEIKSSKQFYTISCDQVEGVDAEAYHALMMEHGNYITDITGNMRFMTLNEILEQNEALAAALTNA